MNIEATQSSKCDEWCTPENVLILVRLVGPIGLDPCTNLDNPTKAVSFWTIYSKHSDGGGLGIRWDGFGLVYVNPPYSKMKLWANKISYESKKGTEIISLVAARPDTKWWKKMVWDSASAVCFWHGRLKFVGALSSAPFPSAIVYHGDDPIRFRNAFCEAGKVIIL